MSAWLSRKVSAFTIHDVDGSEAQKEAVNLIAKEFEVSTENLRTIVKQFNEDIDKGLQRHGATGRFMFGLRLGIDKMEERGKCQLSRSILFYLSSGHDSQFCTRPTYWSREG